MLLHNYLEVVIWFALFYLSFNYAFDNAALKMNTITQSIAFSFSTITSFGYATTFPISRLGHVLTILESTIGVFMALIILARFVSLLPKPKTKDELEQ